MMKICGALGRSRHAREEQARGASRRIVRAAAMAALALTVAACGGRRAEQSPSDPGAGSVDRPEIAAPEIGRGVPVDPQTGQAIIAVLAPTGAANAGVSEVGRGIANAAALAAEDIGDPSLVVRVYDTGGTPAGARGAAELAVAEGASLIVGPLFARNVEAVAPVAADAGVAVIAFSTDVQVAGENVFLIGMLLESEIDRIVGYAARQGVLAMGAMAPSTAQGDVAVGALTASAGRHGVDLVATIRYQQDFQGIEEASRRYADLHKEMGAVAPIQAVFLADSGQALQSVGAYLAYFNVDPSDTRYLGAGIWNSATTLREPSLRGGWFAAPEPGPQRAFAQRYFDRFGERPHALASLGFDGVAAAGVMLSDARARGDSYPFTVQAITAPAGFVGVNGVYRFRADGLNERGLAVLEVRESNFAVIDPAPTTFVGY